MRNSTTGRRTRKSHPFGRSWKAETGRRDANPQMTPDDAATEARIDALLRERGQHEVADARMARRAAQAALDAATLEERLQWQIEANMAALAQNAKVLA